MKKILCIILIFINYHCYANDVYITISGDSYSEARNAASRLAASQGLKIIGQNYAVDGNKKWHVIFKLRSIYEYEN